MVNRAPHICGYLLAIAGWMMSIFTSLYPAWKRSVIQPEKDEAPPIMNVGIWHYCFDEVYSWTCLPYDSPLPRGILLFRVLTSLVIAFGYIGIIIGTIGLNCTTLASRRPRVKSRLAITAGIIHVIAGLVLGGIVTLFAATAFREMNSASLQILGIYVTSHSPGESLYVGWASAVANLLGGFTLCCTARNQDEHVMAKPIVPKSPEEDGLIDEKQF